MSKPTSKALENALIRLKHGRPNVVDKKRKISISALAEEAGVADSTIHNCYPEIAAQVRQIISKEHKSQRDKKSQELKTLKSKYQELRAEKESLEAENQNLVSINVTLEDENDQLRAELASGNVVRIIRN